MVTSSVSIRYEVLLLLEYARSLVCVEYKYGSVLSVYKYKVGECDSSSMSHTNDHRV